MSLKDLLLGADPAATIHLETGAGPIPARFRAAPGARALLVSFHGAVDREKRVPPVFVPFLSLEGAHQLSLSDPSMLRPGRFTMSWYSGHEGLPLQELLPGLVRSAAEALGVERVILFGSSGGGFAALLCSWHLPGSLAVAGVPQTNMATYYAGHIARYREECWPSADGNEALSRLIRTDLCALYAQGTPNTVIYLQSAGDRFHLQTQMVPFAAAVTGVKGSRFILDCGFWGRLGHSGSVTPEAYLPWLRAGLASPSLEVDALLSTRHGLSPAAAAPASAAPAARKGPDPADLRLAGLLRDLHLGEP